MKTLEFPEIVSSRNGDTENEQPQETAAVTKFDWLPDSILGEILSRVPAKTVFRCMSVSKPWLSVIDSHSFSRAHFSRSSVCPLLVFSDPSGRKSNRILHLVEGRSHSELDPKIGLSKLSSRIEFPDVMKGPSSFLRGVNTNATSCEGVVCWATRRGAGDILLCNPITGEYVTLNHQVRNRNNEREVASVFIGLGFSRVTKTFELLKMMLGNINNAELSIAWWPELCTVGTKSWRRVGDVVAPQLDFTRKVFDVIYINGAIYWRYKGEPSICSFDFDRLLFKVILLPEFDGLLVENSFINMSLGVLADSLCVSLISANDGHVEVWAITNNNVGCQAAWRKLYNVETTTTLFEHGGRLWPRGQYRTIKYMENEKILMHDWRTTFLLYDPVTRSESFFHLVESSNLEKMRTLLHLQVVPHLPSIISLKDTLNIQEESVKILKAYSR
ncbi:hypothetical protein Pfo_022524 [Paulownia fortunei]|nr:hypothetical protein Pfo_022524 [Paulownia fortunei]